MRVAHFGPSLCGTMKQDSARPRLDPDVRKLVERNAEANSRSIPKEVNFALRMHYNSVATTYEQKPLRMQWDQKLKHYEPTKPTQPSAKSVKLCRCP